MFRLPAAAIAAALSIGLTACATSGGASTQAARAGLSPLDDDTKVSIVFESYNLLQAGLWSDTINGLIADFEAEHPNIDVKAQPTQGTSTAGGNTVGSVQTQMLAGSAPDVAQITFDGLAFAVNELQAQNLTELVGDDGLAEHFGGEHPFHPRAATLSDQDGSTYGLPYVFSTPVLWYNATAFEKAGLPADTSLATWDDVLTAGQKITAATGKPSVAITCASKGGNWCMQGIFRSAGARVLSEDRSTIQFGEPEAVAAVEKLRELHDAGVLVNSDVTSQYEDFAAGKVAIHLQTSALQSAFMAGAKTGGWDLRATTMPAFEGHDVVPTNSGSTLMMFATDPDKQAAAWELMKFMTSAHAYDEISTGIGYLPLRTSLTTDPAHLKKWADANPLIQPNLEQLDELEPWVSYPGDSFTQVDDILAGAIEDSVYFGKDPAATMAEAQERAQELIQ